MKTFNLYLQYLRRFISYYIEGRESSLSELIDLEAGLYHDLKGLYTKRLGLLINKYESGAADETIKLKILEGASNVAKLLTEERSQLFYTLSPDVGLVSLYRLVYQLEKAVKSNDIKQCLQLLQTIKEHSDAIYSKRVQGKHFELASLLDQVVIELKPEKQISLNLSIADSRHSLKLPYPDFNTWRRLFQNFVINGIEACEATGRGGMVEIKLSFPEKGKAQVEITDNGIGMDLETLSNFTKRGFTRGKTTGQGLGINEDTILFINRCGKFEATSTPGKGTTFAIEIDSNKIAGSRGKFYWISPILKKRLRLSAAFLISVSAIYLLLSIPLEVPRFWASDRIVEFNYSRPDPSDSTHYHGLEVINKEGRVFREYLHPSPQYMMKSTIENDFSPKFIGTTNNGRPMLIYSVNSDDEQKDGTLVCTSGDKEPLWIFEPGPRPDRAIFDFPKDDEGRFSINCIQTLKKFDQMNSVVLCIAAAYHYPNHLFILDTNGKLLRDYWHAGGLLLSKGIEPINIDNDKQEELILYGINCEFGWSPVLVAIDFNNIEGQSLPYIDSLWPPAKEDVYYVFGHAWLKENNLQADTLKIYSKGKDISRVAGEAIYLKNDQIWKGNEPTPMEYICYTTQDGREIILDKSMRLIKIRIDIEKFSKWWDDRVIYCEKRYNWSTNDTLELRGYRKYVNGQLVEDSIKINIDKYDYKYWIDK